MQEVETKYDEEIGHYKEQLMNASENVNKDREFLVGETDRLKTNNIELERELSEVQSSYERDKALWEGKFTFLEQQKEQCKSDLTDAQRKFEMTLEQLQKRGSVEKDKMENSQHTILATMEQKFKHQIKEQTETNQRLHGEMNEKVKTLEKENRQLQNRLQLEQRDKMSDHGTMEKRVHELIDNETKL